MQTRISDEQPAPPAIDVEDVRIFRYLFQWSKGNADRHGPTLTDQDHLDKAAACLAVAMGGDSERAQRVKAAYLTDEAIERELFAELDSSDED